MHMETWKYGQMYREDVGTCKNVSIKYLYYLQTFKLIKMCCKKYVKVLRKKK